MNNSCVEVGDANPDIAGIGILLSFGIQALFTIVISALAFGVDRAILRLYTSDAPFPRFLNRDTATWVQLSKVIAALLQTNSDVQTMTGISLLIAALVQINTLAFYHMHLVYDTVSFVSISTSAALICSLDLKTAAGIIRCILIGVWAVLYLIYTSFFGKRLQSWSLLTPGHCYDTYRIALPTARHPFVDDLYIGITCFWVFFSLCMIVIYLYEAAHVKTRHLEILRGLRLIGWYPFLVLAVAFLQFPLHAYSVLTLRKSNESLLASGSTEQEWRSFIRINRLYLRSVWLWNFTDLQLNILYMPHLATLLMHRPSFNVRNANEQASLAYSLATTGQETNSRSLTGQLNEGVYPSLRRLYKYISRSPF